ncbi:MAG: DUF4837 family protein [Candidatus Latescibacteria bacterium]|nr:DUF4837 family protein [bacterium]MBD3424105.1 DUF4837 family protein [Candidatus Latescibacterota bacterium]
MKKIILLLLAIPAILALSCQQGMVYPPAGSYSDVVLVTETAKPSGENVAIIRALQHELNYYTKNEIQFKLSMVRASEIRKEPPTKNMVIYGVARSGEIGNVIESFIGTAAVRKVIEGNENIFKRMNYPVTGQLTVVVTAPTRRQLVDVTRKNGALIREIIEKHNRMRLRDYLLKEQKDQVRKRLKIEYGFEIGISSLYEINQEREDVPGVEIIRRTPHRGISVFWQKWDQEYLALSDSTKLYNIRAELAWKMYYKDVMRRDLVSFSRDELGNYDVIRMDGYWEKKDDIYGGPFICYFILDGYRKKLWVVDLLVYAPGFDKHILLRELMSIAESFRY